MPSTTEYQDNIGLKQTGSHTYTAAWHEFFAVGPAVHGGTMASIIQMAASLHLSTTLAHVNQPDILTFHAEFIRIGVHAPFEIKVTDLKVGKGSSHLQLHLYQNDEAKVIAMVTSTNFDVVLGPSIQTPLLEPLRNIPDFAALERHERQDDCFLHRERGPFMTGIHRLRYVYPRRGFSTPGQVDLWHGFEAPERIQLPHLTSLTDMYPSMSDTLLRSGGSWDANRVHADMMAWDAEHPGEPHIARTTSEEAASTRYWNNTLVLDIEFKRRLPKDGLAWAHTHVETSSLQNGRMETSAAIFGAEEGLLCLSKQVWLVLDSSRRYKEGKDTPKQSIDAKL